MRLRHLTLAALVALAAAPAGAQYALPPDAPVRYDADYPAAAFHASRRAAVLDALPGEAVAVVLGAPVRNRSNDVDYEYRADNDLYYLSGATEPGSALALAPGGVRVDGELVTAVLFVPARDPAHEVWEGRLFGAERAESVLGIEKALPLERFDEVLAAAVAEGDRRLYHLPLAAGVPAGSALARQHAALAAHARLLAPEAAAALRLLARAEARFDASKDMVRQNGERLAAGDATASALVADYLAAPDAATWHAARDARLAGFADATALRGLVTDLRMVKADAEMPLLRRAIAITTEAQRQAMRSIEPGMAEYEVEALIEYVFKRNGAEDPGFPSIVGSGENSTILHYNTNRRTMEAGDLVVMDIGAEVRGYAADVTRTVPVSGTFSPEQRAIYELVLRAQEAGIAACRAGAPFGAADEAARAVIGEGLVALGLIASADQNRRFFLHGTSHYLGLDVHDVGTYGPLAAGHVLTVEPGVYIAPAPDVDPKWWHIGVRIEDDVLVTAGEPVVLSADAPREVAAIEALMRERGLGNEPAGRLAR